MSQRSSARRLTTQPKRTRNSSSSSEEEESKSEECSPSRFKAERSTGTRLKNNILILSDDARVVQNKPLKKKSAAKPVAATKAKAASKAVVKKRSQKHLLLNVGDWIGTWREPRSDHC